MLLFFEIFYTGKVELKGVMIGDLFELYHICDQNGFKYSAGIVSEHLLSLLNATNLSQMLDFYISSGQKKFFVKIQENMKLVSTNELCSIYAKCREKNHVVLKDVVVWMVSTIKKDTCSSWISALNEHGIEDQSILDKLASTLNSDTFRLWHVLRNELKRHTSESDNKIAMLLKQNESEHTVKKRKRDTEEGEIIKQLKEDYKSILERLDQLEKVISKKKKYIL